MSSPIYTHRGFLIKAGSTPAPDWYDLPIVAELYERLVKEGDLSNNWEYVNQVIQVATQFFARQFSIEDHLRAPSSPWMTSRFLIDTLRYLVDDTPRAISVFTFVDMLPYHPSRKDYVAGLPTEYSNSHLVRYLDELKKVELVSRWLSRPNGLNDLVSTLYLVAAPLPLGWENHTKIGS